jgi:hypothetical protein
VSNRSRLLRPGGLLLIARIRKVLSISDEAAQNQRSQASGSPLIRDYSSCNSFGLAMAPSLVVCSSIGENKS